MSALKLIALRKKSGFTLIELMIVVAIIGLLAGIAIPQFATLISKASEGQTKGNLATLRSSLSVYYSEMEGVYPLDATLLTTGGKYLRAIPNANLPKTINSNGHSSIATITATAAQDGGGWYYNNTPASNTFGNIVVSCSHSDFKGGLWTSY